jgi:hypothetical protein
MHPFVPILHRPTLERSVQAGLHFEDHRFGEMLLAMCALASRYSQDPRVILEGTNSEYSCGWKWFRQLRFFHACFVQAPCLYEIQTYCVRGLSLTWAISGDSLLDYSLRWPSCISMERQSRRRVGTCWAWLSGPHKMLEFTAGNLPRRGRTHHRG